MVRGRGSYRGTSRGASRGAFRGSRRGGSRGSGRGAYRGVRGAGIRGRIAVHRGSRRTYTKPFEGDVSDSKIIEIVDLNINHDPKSYFINAAVTLDQHIEAQTTNLCRYLAAMFALDRNSVEITQKAKACALAAAWCRHDKKLATSLLQHRRLFGLTEVLKAVMMLDAARQIRVQEKKLKRLESTKTKTKANKLGKIKNTIDNLNKLKPSSGSVTSTVARQIKCWARTLSTKELEYFALHMPIEPWRKLADIVHFNPTEDFSALPWFLPFCFGQPAPSDSMVANCRTLTRENVNSLLKEFKIPYSHLKQFNDDLDNDSKARIAANEEKLDTILWYYEDLACREVDDVIQQRIQAGEEITLPYGKLMERLLLFRLLREPNADDSHEDSSESHTEVPEFTDDAKFYPDLLPIAEAKLQKIKLPLESPVAVLADASFSMEVAIHTATILSSLLTAICSATLTFFHNVPFRPAFVPKTIEDVIMLALMTEAGPCTANAIALAPYYESKEVIKTFIMVSDEEENTAIQLRDGKEIRFFDLFMKYRAEVYPAKLVFISFLAHQHDKGQIYSQFVNANVPDVLQVRKYDISFCKIRF